MLGKLVCHLTKGLHLIKIYRIGEKYLEWPDAPLSKEAILELITLYWFTESFPRAIYPYREVDPGIQITVKAQVADDSYSLTRYLANPNYL